jgi:hypothetical protein
LISDRPPFTEIIPVTSHLDRCRRLEATLERALFICHTGIAKTASISVLIQRPFGRRYKETVLVKKTRHRRTPPADPATKPPNIRRVKDEETPLQSSRVLISSPMIASRANLTTI